MILAQISKADSFGGGASRVAEHLYLGFKDRGYFSHHLASWSGKGFAEGVYPLYGRYEKWIRRSHLLTKKLFAPEIIPFELVPLMRHHERSHYNLLHFHDLSSAISPFTLDFLSTKLPVVWTIHDCSAVTGGCLYPMGCEKYKQSCFGCPQKGRWPVDSKLDFIWLSHWAKKNLHKKKKITLVTPSAWMADFIASSGFVDRQSIKVISNGIDLQTFKPQVSKDKSSTKLKVLISSGDISDERKGVALALETLRLLKHLNIEITVVGNVSDDARKLFSEFHVDFAGYISSEDEMAKHYASADLFLFCSLADNQPLAVMESLACGTPVFGFKTGGVQEMIVNGFNGALVEQRDVNSLATEIETLWNSESFSSLSTNARHDACSKYGLDLMLDKHLELYEELIHSHLAMEERVD